MERTVPQSPLAASAFAIVDGLQRRFVSKLEALCAAHDDPVTFEAHEWLRDEGRHGGGVRYSTGDTQIFNRGSVNVSVVHYDDDPSKKLSSATALSTIIHPRNPHGPSVHIHVSWTEMRNGDNYWRVMADLNPAIVDRAAAQAFEAALREAAPTQFESAKSQGERYFFIPALGRHRGVAHFYLEGYSTSDREADSALAQAVGQAAIDCYVDLLDDALRGNTTETQDDRAQQLAYHTLYLFQVLTLDRGTTSGLLVHDQNDVGILGSLPAVVDRQLLASWGAKLTPPQDTLVAQIVEALPTSSPCVVTTEVKQALAQVVRRHYQTHPSALTMQASGDIVPPTVDNHR